MVVNEDLILDIVRPGTGDPVAECDVDEIVVTSLGPHHPWIRRSASLWEISQRRCPA